MYEARVGSLESKLAKAKQRYVTVSVLLRASVVCTLRILPWSAVCSPLGWGGCSGR
jgi:hypothetical protein